MMVPPDDICGNFANRDNQSPRLDAPLRRGGKIVTRISSSAVGKAIFSALFRK
jgi:hypothetical protein